MSEVNLINNPQHYHKHAVLVEPIQLCEQLGFCLGNCLKYCFRYQDKGNPLQDLQKAQFYIKRILADDFHVWESYNKSPWNKKAKVYIDIFSNNEFVNALSVAGYMGLADLIDKKIEELQSQVVEITPNEKK